MFHKTFLPRFSFTNERKKRVRFPAVILLMRRRSCAGEAHHRQKLGKELRAEMPPRVPEEIFRRRRQATDRRALQVRMELVDDNE